MQLLKLIICEVELDKVSAFSKSQCAWHQLNDNIGFNGQLGGWTACKNEGDTSIETAIVLGFWQSKEHVDAFMSKTHDKIFIKSEQGLTYRHCNVNYYKQLESDGQKNIDYSGYKVAVITHFTSLLSAKQNAIDMTKNQLVNQLVHEMKFHVQYWQHCKNEAEYIKIVFCLDVDAFNQYQSRCGLAQDFFKDSLAVSSQILIELEDNWNVKSHH